MTIPFAARRIDAPEPGYFCRRRVAKGWEVPGQICRNEAGKLYAVIDGVTFPAHDDPELDVNGVMWLWQGARQITEAHYRWLAATRAWADRYNPDHPAVNTLKPIDLSRLKPV